MQIPTRCSLSLDMKMFNNDVFVKVPCEHRGIFMWSNSNWNVILSSVDQIQMHGFDFIGDNLIITNPVAKKVQLVTAIDDRHKVRDWAGSGEGPQDGPACKCQFGQPTGIVVENNKTVYVTDTQTGSIKLLVDIRPAAKFCTNIGRLYAAFGIHKKGQAPIQVDIQHGLALMEDVSQYIDEISSVVTDNIDKIVTNGPDGTISSKTQGSIKLVVDGVQQLLNHVMELNPSPLPCKLT